MADVKDDAPPKPKPQPVPKGVVKDDRPPPPQAVPPPTPSPPPPGIEQVSRPPVPPAVQEAPPTPMGVQKAEGIYVDTPNVRQAQDLARLWADDLARLLGVPIETTSIVEGGGGGDWWSDAIGRALEGSMWLKPGWEPNRKLVIHELTHSFTLGDRGGAPTWLIEGIAEWAEDKLGGNELRYRPGDFTSMSSIRGGYDAAAAFIEWLGQYRPEAGKRLAQALNTGQYSEQWFTREFGAKPAVLMDRYREAQGQASIFSTIGELSLEGVLTEDSPLRTSEAPRLLAAVYQLSPYAWRVARTIADMQEARGVTTLGPNYGYEEYMQDVLYALTAPPSYLEMLELETIGLHRSRQKKAS